MFRTALLTAAALALVAASPETETRHVVEAGETLNGIANRAGVSADDLARANGLEPPYPLRAGQTLTIPRKAKTAARVATSSAMTHVVQPGETLNGIANRAGVAPADLASVNDLAPPYPLRAGQKLTLPKGAKQPTTKPASATLVKPAPAPVSSGIEASATQHVVQPGETLNGIANRAGVPAILIAEANGLSEPYPVQAGQTLTIPRQKSHVVAPGETGFGISYQYGVPWSAIAVANGLEPDAKVREGQKLLIPAITQPPARTVSSGSAPAPAPVAPKPAPTVAAAPTFLWPVRGATLLGFSKPGLPGGHNGIDIAAPAGEPVRAAAPGKVVFAGDEPKTYGTLVVIKHAGGWHSAYGHLSATSVTVGQQVSTGDIVGKVGQTGAAHQPALHFELRKDNFPIDPATKIAGSPAP
ncbi:MAG: LysM peptidoglycan-binding domain-containing protein [Novosphingobium sp.]